MGTLFILFSCLFAIAAIGTCIKKYHFWRENSPVMYYVLMVWILFSGLLLGQSLPIAMKAWGITWFQKLIFVWAYGNDGRILGSNHVLFLVSALLTMVLSTAFFLWLLRKLGGMKFIGGFVSKTTSSMTPFVMPVVVLFIMSLVGAHCRSANWSFWPITNQAAETGGVAIANMSGAVSELTNEISKSKGQRPTIPEDVTADLEQAEAEGEAAAEAQPSESNTQDDQKRPTKKTGRYSNP